MKSRVTGETPPQSLTPAPKQLRQHFLARGSAAPARSCRGRGSGARCAAQPTTSSSSQRRDVPHPRARLGMEGLDDHFLDVTVAHRRCAGSSAACPPAPHRSRRCPAACRCVNGIRSSPASSCMRMRGPAPCRARTGAACPCRAGAGSWSPASGPSRRSTAAAAPSLRAVRMPALVCGSMPPSKATRQASTSRSVVEA